ncbi:hypothetical protein BBJ28_00020363 [Nothophytophthora sp. Chile5]|nr:hypothetical protein BBJ28_00020363 [Nothophytophthora sp. Chile5]
MEYGYDSEEDPVAAEHDANMRFQRVRASKSVAEMSRLRKLTSLAYLGGKLRGMFHREHRDTIVCEEDEESASGRRNIYDIIRRNEELAARRASGPQVRPGRAQTTAGFDLSKFVGAVPSVRPVAFASSSPTGVTSYEPSKEQRWCTNCSKCFQRGLSHYDQYCGLDCKTAHRLRLSA